MSDPQYEVYAIKYAHHERRASENFLGGDPHDGPMPLDYFVWAIHREGHPPLIVDTGFGEAAGRPSNTIGVRTPGMVPVVAASASVMPSTQ